MRLRYHEDRRFYKPESGCPSSLYGEKRVTDVTKETLTRQVISPMISQAEIRRIPDLLELVLTIQEVEKITQVTLFIRC